MREIAALGAFLCVTLCAQQIHSAVLPGTGDFSRKIRLMHPKLREFLLAANDGENDHKLPRRVTRTSQYALNNNGEEGVPLGSSASIQQQTVGRLHTFTPLPTSLEPLERMLLVANGNLQRLMSAYYNKPIHIRVVGHTELCRGIYEREVEEMVQDRVFCKARSVIAAHTPQGLEAIRRGNIGIGQLFHAFKALPEFELVQVDRKDGVLYRIYDLRCTHISCRIYEEYSPGFLSPTFSAQTSTHSQP